MGLRQHVGRARVRGGRDDAARVMDRETPHGCGMLAVRGLRRDDVASLAGDAHEAIVVGVDHVVLAGDDAGLVAAAERLVAHGATVRRLDVRVPSHTPILQHASDAFRAALVASPPGDVAVPVLRGCDGRPCRRGDEAADALAEAISHTIRWDRCEERMAEAGVSVLLESDPAAR